MGISATDPNLIMKSCAASTAGARRTIISAVALALLLALLVVPPLVVSAHERGCREPAELREANLVRRAFPSTKRFHLG
eukprot:COSAG01_NODE_10409_length_2173_cov_3.048216_2_plen_79_part_00